MARQRKPPARAVSISSSSSADPDTMTPFQDSVETSAATSAGPSSPTAPDTTTSRSSKPSAADKAKADAQTSLAFLLRKSAHYSSFIGEKMNKERQLRQEQLEREEKRAAAKAEQALKAEHGGNDEDDQVEAVVTRRGGKGKGKASTGQTEAAQGKGSSIKVKGTAATASAKIVGAKRKTNTTTLDPSLDLEAAATQTFTEDTPFAQPKLLTGAVLRDYQLAGVNWLISLYENGVNGILADDMGLGKTIQTIAFIAHLVENQIHGPFLIVAPLSVVANWVTEFEKYAPTIPVMLYHGTPGERTVMREEQLGLSKSKAKGKGKRNLQASPTPSSSSSSSSFSSAKGPPIETVDMMPVIITTYDIIINDRVHLTNLNYNLIVTDEAHRLKNFECKLIQELKCYNSSNRLLLTGTPLHNNLSELWSLLSYIMPDIFDDLNAFKSWFDLSSVTTALPANATSSGLTSETTSMVEKLHGILAPFLLRRLKVDVEKNLPLKKEYLLSAPLTPSQKVLYDHVLKRELRSYLINEKLGLDVNKEEETKVEVDDDEVEVVEPPRKRARTSVAGRSAGYAEQEDEEYFDSLESAEAETVDHQESTQAIGQAYAIKQAVSQVNSMNLNNVVMQLRKVCNHPYLFNWPIDNMTGQPVVNDQLLAASGKMLLLDRLLQGLFAEGRKVLLFSQFTTQLDIIHAWANERKMWDVYRIDGTTKIGERKSQMKAFNEDQSEDAVRLFLLSTRAGGVGVTLTGADTVIIFDSDWNPMQDLQAMDRAHRIGQVNPVLVFRLVTANTIEGKILDKAAGKRKLETLVVGQGTFKFDQDDKGHPKSLNAVALEAALMEKADEIVLASEGDVILNDEQLARLLDRSDETMQSKASWAGGEFDTVKFAVVETNEDSMDMGKGVF